MEYTLYAVTPDGDRIGVMVSSDATLGDLKAQLVSEGLFDVGHNDLCTEEDLLEDDELLLADLNIATDSAVFVQVKKEHVAHCRLRGMGIRKIAWVHVCEAAENNDIAMVELIGAATTSIHTILSGNPAPTSNFTHTGHSVSCTFPDRGVTHERLRLGQAHAAQRDTASPATESLSSPEAPSLAPPRPLPGGRDPHRHTASLHVDPVVVHDATEEVRDEMQLPVYQRQSSGEGPDSGQGGDADWRVSGGVFSPDDVEGERADTDSTPVFDEPLPLHATESFRDFYDTPPVMHLPVCRSDSSHQRNNPSPDVHSSQGSSPVPLATDDVARPVPQEAPPRHSGRVAEAVPQSATPAPPPPERNPEWQAWYAKPFVISAVKGYEECLRAIIRCGGRINEAPCIGIAVARGSSPASIAMLLRNGADPNLCREGNPPLVSAANARMVDATRVLLEYGADPNIPSRDGLTPLFTSVASRATQMVDLLLAPATRTDVNYSILQELSTEESVAVHGFSPAYTAMSKAVQLNEFDMVSRLFDSGAALGVRDGSGANLLHLAIRPGRVDTRVLTLLLQSNPQLLHEVDLEGTTPLMQAAKAGIPAATLHKMLKLGFSGIHDPAERAQAMQSHLGLKDTKGRTALFHAVARRKCYKGCVRNCRDVIALFCTKYRSASVDEPSFCGETPLSRYLQDVADRLEPTGEPSWFLDMSSNPRLRSGSPRVRAYTASDGADSPAGAGTRPVPLTFLADEQRHDRAGPYTADVVPVRTNSGSATPSEDADERSFCPSPTASELSDASAQSGDSGPSQRQYLLKWDFLCLVTILRATRDTATLFLPALPRGARSPPVHGRHSTNTLYRLVHICSAGFRWHADRCSSAGKMRTSAVDWMLTVVSQKLSDEMRAQECLPEEQRRPHKAVDVRGADGMTLPMLAAASQDLIEKGVNLALLLRVLWKAQQCWSGGVPIAPFDAFCKSELEKRDTRAMTALMHVVQQATEKHLPKLGSHRYLNCHCGHSRRGTLRFMQQLLRYGADPNARDLSGNSAVSVAAAARDTEVVKLLVKAGADPNTATPKGVPILMLDPDSLGEYVSIGADVNRTNSMGQNVALRTDLASLHDPLQFVELYVSAGGDVNAQDSTGRSFLMKCVEEYPALASTIAPRCADVNHTDEEGRTALMRSVIASSTAPNGMSSNPVSPSSFSCSVLLKCGASITAVDYSLNTVLHHAALSGASSGLFKHLISQGARLNVKNAAGHTPLSLVVSERPSAEDIVSQLVAAGADVGVEVAGSDPLLLVALQNCPTRVLKVLLESPGADFTATCSEGCTLLMKAIGSKRIPVSVFEHILGCTARQGALNARDKKGLTALHHGVSSDRVKHVELLLNALREKPEELLPEDLDLALSKSVTSPSFIGVASLLTDHGADMKRSVQHSTAEPFVFTLIKRFGALPTAVPEGLSDSDSGGLSTAPRLLYSTVPSPNSAALSPHLARVTRAFSDVFRNKVSWWVCNSKGETCLMHALQHGIWCVPLIVSAEADARSPACITDYSARHASTGRTVLHYVAAGGSYPYVKAHTYFNLIYDNFVAFEKARGCTEAGADAPDNEGVTPLMVALQHSRVAAVGSLLSKGASLNATDGSGRPAWAYATQECMQFLCSSDLALQRVGLFCPLSHAIVAGIDPLPPKLLPLVDGAPAGCASEDDAAMPPYHGVPPVVLAALLSSLCGFSALLHSSTGTADVRVSGTLETPLIALCKSQGAQLSGALARLRHPVPVPSLVMKLRRLLDGGSATAELAAVDSSGRTAHSYAVEHPSIPPALAALLC